MMLNILIFPLLHVGVQAFSFNISQPPQLQVLLGQSVTFACFFNIIIPNATEPFISWLRQGKQVKSHQETCNCSLSQCKALLHIPQVGRAHSGIYICEVWIPSTIQTMQGQGQGTLLVIHAPPSVGAVYNKVAKAGEKLLLTCNIEEFYPESITVTWRHMNGTEVTTGVNKYPARKSRGWGFSMTSYLRLFPRAKDHEIRYTCEVNHSTLQKPISKDFHLSVKYGPMNHVVYQRSSAEALPSVLAYPTVSRTPGGFLELQCIVESDPPSRVQWLNQSGLQLAEGFHSNATLTLNPLQEADTGTYACNMSNHYGSLIQKVHIEVRSPDSLGARWVTYPLFLLCITTLLLYRRFGQEYHQAHCVTQTEQEGMETPTMPGSKEKIRCIVGPAIKLTES